MPWIDNSIEKKSKNIPKKKKNTHTHTHTHAHTDDLKTIKVAAHLIRRDLDYSINSAVTTE